MSKIVMTGKRTRKPKQEEYPLDKPEYGNGTRCVVSIREYEFYNFETKKSIKSKYEVSLYETNNLWGISNHHPNLYIAINTLAEAQKFVEENFGGKWKWDKVKRKLINIRECSSWNEVFDKTSKIYDDTCKKFENYDQKEKDLFENLRINAKTALNWFRNAFHEKEDLEGKKLEEAAYFAIRCTEDLVRFFDKEYDYE